MPKTPYQVGKQLGKYKKKGAVVRPYSSTEGAVARKVHDEWRRGVLDALHGRSLDLDQHGVVVELGHGISAREAVEHQTLSGARAAMDAAMDALRGMRGAGAAAFAHAMMGVCEEFAVRFRRSRNAALRREHQQGASLGELAARLGVSRQAVHQVVQAAGGATGKQPQRPPEPPVPAT
jgi:hypothetical protein